MSISLRRVKHWQVVMHRESTFYLFIYFALITSYILFSNRMPGGIKPMLCIRLSGFPFLSIKSLGLTQFIKNTCFTCFGVDGEKAGGTETRLARIRLGPGSRTCGCAWLSCEPSGGFSSLHKHWTSGPRPQTRCRLCCHFTELEKETVEEMDDDVTV